MGTMLFARGVERGACPELANAERPELLEEIAQAYFDAGAQIVQTNTFGGSPAKLAHYGLSDRCEELCAAAVKAVRKAVGQDAYVSASCGPCGELLKPYGTGDPDELRAGFKRQIGAMVDAGADIICVETMTDINEAKLAIEAAKTVAPDTPVMATMTFDQTKRGYFTMMGVSIQAAATILAEVGADILGSNCGNGIDRMIEIAREFRELSDLPLLIQSNAGLPEMVDGEAVYRETPEKMAEKVPALLEAGVSIIGGCCGTTPEHIRAIREAVAACA